jgi:hypothetical protein
MQSRVLHWQMDVLIIYGYDEVYHVKHQTNASIWNLILPGFGKISENDIHVSNGCF